MSHRLVGMFSSHVSLRTKQMFIGKSNINHMLALARHVQSMKTISGCIKKKFNLTFFDDMS